MAGKRLLNYLRHGLAIFAACSLLNAAEHRGLVKFSGLPLPGATVTAVQGDKKFSVVTDQSGVYSFRDLADGNWNLKVEMLCFTPIEREVAVSAQAPAPEWEMKLLPFDEIKASAPPPPPSATPAATPAAGTPASAATASNTPAKPTTTAAAPKKGSGPKLPKGTPPPQAANSASGFQRASANASADAPKD